MNSKISVPDHEWWWGGAVADGEHSAARPTAPSPQPCHVERPDRRRQRRREPVGAAARLEPGPLRVVRTSLRVRVRRPGKSGGRRRRTSSSGRTATGWRPPSGRRLAGSFRPRAGRPTSGCSPLRSTTPGSRCPIDPPSRRCSRYARGLLDAGFPPGVLMIDDQWSVDYGNWTFDRARFPDPAEMCRELARPRLPGDALAGAVRQPGRRELPIPGAAGLADHRDRTASRPYAAGGTATARCST